MTRPERRGRPGGATIEIVRRGTRDGIVIEVNVESLQVIRMLLESAFDVAGAAALRRVTDPGWWAAHVAAEAVNSGLVVSVQRTVERLERHVVLAVEPGRLAELHPQWPLVRLRPSGAWLDLRGETSLRHGPSDAELEDFGAGLPDLNRPTLADLRRMFDVGVLQWERHAPSGRRRVVHAQTD